MAKKFSSKDPEETILITFDYTDLMADSTEAITSIASWEISVKEGVDASPNSVFTGLPTFDSTTATRLVTGGIDGVTYLISCTVNTNKDQVLKMTASLPVITQGN